MLRHALRFALIVLTALPLMAFRMPAENERREKLLYDVRGAFVTARPDVPQGLVIATDMLIDEAIRATVRSIILPRTIITVRIDTASHVPLLIGSRHEARVTVRAISVASGEPIAEGSFKTSIFLLDTKEADKELAGRIAERIAGEFKLDGGQRPAIASALFP
ncbi:hypothetical protein J2046_005070 [Rhizobium petrolearium]|uniref:hypothetical protein n=1 Tax=Neorhizobium petrolearium TaxID=515361 RepID=UPI001AE1A443|nr:hypothetical protein [Neorhizobium petrolearium]MBP1846792.1 hypothetical protein [Neorhizobium petrolearium]